MDVPAARRRLPLTPSFFDVRAADGEVLRDLPARERYAVLARLVPEAHRVRRLAVE
ncbi:ATP-dependent DNA ligase, partial [Streptomyces bambusae]|nr:ATP-dependent DNA ligase [Streptomyces bambusae]